MTNPLNPISNVDGADQDRYYYSEATLE